MSRKLHHGDSVTLKGSRAMTRDTAVRLRRAAGEYLDVLGDIIEDESVFLILDECARRRGFAIRAEQRGVFGTHITFENIVSAS